MVPVPVYLKKLLYQYDCVIVPQLGGFILHYLPATYQDSNKLFLPPRKKVAFNQALKLDDGVLIHYMMLHEQISREESKRRIGDFVDDLKNQVRVHGSCTIEGIGLFSGNEEGSLQFDPELRHNFFGESYGMHPIAATPAQVESEPELETRVEAAEEVNELLTEVPVIAFTPERSRRTGLGWAAAAMLIATVGFMSYLTMSQVPGQLVSSLNPFDIVWSLKAASAKPVETPVPTPSAIKSVPATKPIPATPRVVTTVSPALKEPVAAPVVPAVAPTVTKLRYVIVAGSFNSRRNARKCYRYLRNKGFSGAYIMPIRRGELVKVAATATNVKPEAVAMVSEVTRKIGAQAWIYKTY